MTRLQRIAREFLPLCLVIIAVLAARSSLADHYLVPSGSMEFTLLPGDHVIADKTAYGLRTPFLGWKLSEGARPARGEVVIFDSPEDGSRLIKRIVAIEGDLVELRGGRLSIDGHKLAASAEVELFGERSAELNLSFGGGPDLGPVRVPAGKVLVIGDSRGNSRDSRIFGFVPAEEIYGRAGVVFYRSDSGFLWKPL